MISIVLVEPEIPANTGNISRTCACTGMPLFLVGKLGFEISESRVKRAGLDYWDKVQITRADTLEELWEKYGKEKFFYFSTKADKLYTEVDYPEDAFLVFGKETKGLPESVIEANLERAVRIPMREELRCLNLSNSVAIGAYEALRRHDFFDILR
ncbi:MAG: tRNA (cytidine(34)-2'-O)-methyltransferase [Clostridia bacterium]|nr:tRNA (cytidine(34)-2'-O)-methyltransferase [Clostridia bacterium]